MTDSTSQQPTIAAKDTTPAPVHAATLILQCKRCGSHFEQDYEELLCWQCVAWAEILERRDTYASAIGRR